MSARESLPASTSFSSDSYHRGTLYDPTTVVAYLEYAVMRAVLLPLPYNRLDDGTEPRRFKCQELGCGRGSCSKKGGAPSRGGDGASLRFPKIGKASAGDSTGFALERKGGTRITP